MDRYNSERFSNYNETENPMNAKGRTIEERFAMRDRRMNAKDRVGKDVHTYSKQLGEPEHRKIMRIKLGRELRDDEVIHHIDGNRYNNTVENLEWVTGSENMIHAYKTGLTQPRGQKPIKRIDLKTNAICQYCE